jgi:16S rRNA (uracil1498-N3)-methyltransferase
LVSHSDPPELPDDGTQVVAQVFVDDLDELRLDLGDQAHLERALRLRPGEWVTVADGLGKYRLTRWQGNGTVEPAGEISTEAILSPPITVALALVKGDRTDWAVQKLTEAGVDRIVPMITDRTVVRWGPDRAERAVGRLRAVARSAAAQSRRARLPTVDSLTTFSDVVAAAGAHGVVADQGGAPPSLVRPWVLIGPEGGWSAAERARGLPSVGLGPTVQRAETAAIAAGVLLCALRSGLVRPVTTDSGNVNAGKADMSE